MIGTIGITSGSHHAHRAHARSKQAARVEEARQQYQQDASRTSAADMAGNSPCCKKVQKKIQTDLAALHAAQQAATSTQSVIEAYAANGPENEEPPEPQSKEAMVL